MKRRKLSAKAERQLDQERETQLQQFEAFRDKFDGLIFKAVVRWFDKSSGVGSVRGLNEEGSWTLYACNIKGAKAWFAETACVYLNEGDVVDVEVKVSYGGSLLVCHTPGELDLIKWDALDHDKLAFRCDDDCKAITDLFVKGASL